MTVKQIAELVKADPQLLRLLKGGKLDALVDALYLKAGDDVVDKTTGEVLEDGITQADIDKFLTSFLERDKINYDVTKSLNRQFTDDPEATTTKFTKNNIKIVGMDTYAGSKIETVKLGNVDIVEQGAFTDSAVKEIYFDKSKPIKLGANCFMGCENLHDLYIPGKAELGDHAFANSGLRRIAFGDGCGNMLKSGKYGDEIFANCKNLFALAFRKDFFEASNDYDFYYDLPSKMFAGCRNITNVQIYDHQGSAAWNACADYFIQGFRTIGDPPVLTYRSILD